MKKLILLPLIIVATLTVVFIACNKGEKITKGSITPAFKSDLERDANSVALMKLISQDKDWKALKQLNYEFLDVLVSSNIPIGDNMADADIKDFGFKDTGYLAKLEEAKRLANKIQNKYFQNSSQCYTCGSFTQKKWKLFTEKINTFRNDKSAYDKFLIKLGVDLKNGNTGAKAPVPDCNNWRFSLCGAACVLTAPTVVVFAGCMALCIAEFC